MLTKFEIVTFQLVTSVNTVTGNSQPKVKKDHNCTKSSILKFSHWPQ